MSCVIEPTAAPEKQPGYRQLHFRICHFSELSKPVSGNKRVSFYMPLKQEMDRVLKSPQGKRKMGQLSINLSFAECVETGLMLQGSISHSFT